MRVLVTGGAGYIGTVLCEALLAVGYDVVVIDTLSRGEAGINYLRKLPSQFGFVKTDIANDLQRSDLNGVGHVVHLAAVVGDPECSKRPADARDVNIGGSIALSKICAQAGVPVIVASTCSNYGKMDEDFVAEGSRLNPVSFYAWTKVLMERVFLECNPEATVLRFATVFGQSPMMRYDLTVNEFTRDLLVKKYLEVYGEQFWRPYIHVQDVAAAIIRTIEVSHAEVAGQVFNVGRNDMNRTKKQLVDEILGVLPSREGIQVRFVAKDEDPRDYKVHFDKIRVRLGFEPKHDVVYGVRGMVEALERQDK